MFWLLCTMLAIRVAGRKTADQKNPHEFHPTLAQLLAGIPVLA